MTGNAFDNLLGGTILPVVAPGGNFSVRLENQTNGANASRLSQTFLVDPSNASFTYKFATVLEDGQHTLSEQAYFRARIKDQNGNTINCVTDFYSPTTPFTGLTYSGGLYYKYWTSRTVLLGSYIGQNVTVEFTAQDCTQTGSWTRCKPESSACHRHWRFRRQNCPGIRARPLPVLLNSAPGSSILPGCPG